MKWIAIIVGGVILLVIMIVLSVRYAHHSQLEAIAKSERDAARANMPTVANANQSYRLQTGKYTAKIADLAGDLGTPEGITGPGTRTYIITLNPKGSCDWDGDGTANAAPASTPLFWVTSSEATDGCFIPGVSPR